MGQQIRQRVKQWTGLPVCVGFGPTKTLAKIANHPAKKNFEFEGVCDLHAIPRPERLQWTQFGRDTVTTGANGTEKRWAMRSENRSPRFTTQWDELPIAT